HGAAGRGNRSGVGLGLLDRVGVQVRLDMGVENGDREGIKKCVFWGSLVTMVAYLWATSGNMVTIRVKANNATTGVVSAVQAGFWHAHWFAVIVALVLMWFFISNTVVYNYSFSRLLFVSGLARRMPAAVGRVHEKREVPVNAGPVQTGLASSCAV